MPQLTDSAHLICISSINQYLAGSKIRIAGRCASNSLVISLTTHLTNSFPRSMLHLHSEFDLMMCDGLV